MLRSLIDVGTLSEADEVRAEGESAWISAGQALASTGSQAVATADDSGAAQDEDDAQWYCRVAGQELGPLTFDDLLRFAENGELTADEEVKYGEHAKWRRVGSI